MVHTSKLRRDADADANAVWMLMLMLLPMLMPMPMPLPTPMHTSDLLLLHVDYLGGGTASCVWMLRLMPIAVADADAHVGKSHLDDLGQSGTNPQPHLHYTCPGWVCPGSYLRKPKDTT